MKITVKLKPENYFALMAYLLKVKKTVETDMQTKQLQMTERSFVIYDTACSIVNSNNVDSWKKRDTQKAYPLSLEMNKAICLVMQLFEMEYKENPELYSCVATMYASLTEFVSPHIFGQKKLVKPTYLNI